MHCADFLSRSTRITIAFIICKCQMEVTSNVNATECWLYVNCSIVKQTDPCDLCHHSPSHWWLYAGCLCMLLWSYTSSLLTWHLINCLWELHQIYNFIAVGHKDKVIWFRDWEVKCQGHREVTCGQITAFWGIFCLFAKCLDVFQWNWSHLFNTWSMWWHVNVMDTQTTYPTMHFYGGGMSIDGVLWKAVKLL